MKCTPRSIAQINRTKEGIAETSFDNAPFRAGVSGYKINIIDSSKDNKSKIQ